MRSGATAYLGLSMLDGLDAMNLLAELIECDVTLIVFIKLLTEHQIDCYICSERLCWFLYPFKHERKKEAAGLASIFGRKVKLSPIVDRDKDMTVLTENNVEVEFSKGTYQKVLKAFLKCKSGKLYFSGSQTFEGVSVTGELVRWYVLQSIGGVLRPEFLPADIQMLADKIKKTGAVHKAPKRYIYLDAEELILNAIKELGYDPTDLPDRTKGKLGLRGIIEAKLDRKYPFDSSPSTFGNQWKRVMKNLRLERLERLKTSGGNCKKTGVLQNDE